MVKRNLAMFVCSLATISGCALTPGAEQREFNLDNGNSLTTDAKLRVISNVNPGIFSRPGRVDPLRIICVEPQPDVAVSIANSFSGGLSILGRGSGSIGASGAANVVQLAERTVAIQAILKQGYQACLDYSNGAINGTTYSLRTSKLDDLLVTLVLGEAAAGGFGRAGASAGQKTSGEARATLSGIPDALQDVQKDRQALADLNKKIAGAKVEFDDAQAAMAKDEENTALQGTRNQKETALKKLEAEKELLLKQYSASIDTLARHGTEVVSITGQGGLTARTDPEIARVLGRMQQRFLEKDSAHSYVSACLIELAMWKADQREGQVYEKQALDFLEAAKAKPEAYLNHETHRPYTLATGLRGKTMLAKLCEDHLPQLMTRLVHQREVEQRFDHEEAMARAASTGAGQSGKPAEVVGTLIKVADAYYRLKAQQASLTGEANALAALKLPGESSKLTKEGLDGLRAEQMSLAQEATNLLAKIKTEAGDKETDLLGVDKRLTDLVSSGDQFAEGDKRTLWRHQLKLQQMEAQFQANRLNTLQSGASQTTGKVKALAVRIKAL